MFPCLGTRQAVLFVFVFLAHGQVALDNNCLGNTRATGRAAFCLTLRYGGASEGEFLSLHHTIKYFPTKVTAEQGVGMANELSLSLGCYS